MHRYSIPVAAAMLGALMAVSGAFTPPASALVPRELNMLDSKCTVCHSLDRVRNKIDSEKMNQEDWMSLITRMQKNGAMVNDNDKADLAAYLANVEDSDSI